MPNPITQAGATVEPSEYATLSMDEQFTGMVTQRSPLRDADVPYLYRKFYSASRFDSILDGINREICTRLTDVRRCGTSPYNSNIFPAINSYYAFKWLQRGTQQLRVVADGQDGTIYDATAGQKSTIFTKSGGAGKARFLGIGPTLYITDGVDTRQWVRSSTQWVSNTVFNAGQFIIDTNLNVQLCIGSQTATIMAIQIVAYTQGGVSGSLVSLYFQPSADFSDVVPGTQIALAGLTTVPALNSTTGTILGVVNSAQVNFFVHPALTPVAYSTETGTATTGNGMTGGLAQPIWSTTIGAVTQDNGAQWECRGSSVRPMGYAAPTTAPTLSQAAAPSLYQPWAANTWYGPAIVILDPNGNAQLLTTSGLTGGSQPSWNLTTGGTTADNTAVWTNRGAAAWAANTVYAAGAIVVVQFTYTITVGQSLPYPPYYQLTQQQVTVTLAFICQTAGTSGANQPGWTNGGNVTVQDNTVTWLSLGAPLSWATIGAAANVSILTKIRDTNGNVQTAQAVGKTGGTAPAWAAAVGSTTPDGNQAWLNAGPYAAANTGAWIYSYSGKDSVTNDVTTESPASLPITQAASQQVVIQGKGLDLRMDTIIIWRTAQDQPTRVFLDEFPNPGPTATWVYTDTTPDIPSNGSAGLNALIAAPTDDENDPPPSSLTALEYHCGRTWGIDGFYVRHSNGPDTLIGNGNNTFPPLNYYQLPEQPIRLKSITVSVGSALLIICQVNAYIILGAGTTSNPFLPPALYMEKAGIASYDAMCMVGSTLYAFTTTNKLVSFDPSSGYQEIGFPIGDQFTLVTTGGISSALYSAAGTYVTWHETSSGETALYVSDGAVGWFRWSPIAPPESGSLWSPRAAIRNGTSAVQSIEVTPGVFKLLIGPPSGTGPILFRDPTVYGDYDVGTNTWLPYASWDVKGSIGLCETGEVAEIAHISMQSVAIGARPIVSLLLDEIKAGVTVEGRTTAWDQLSLDDGHHEDPPNLEPSITLYSDRYKTSSTAETPKCMHFQFKVDYGQQMFADELMKFAVFGAVFKERRQQ